MADDVREQLQLKKRFLELAHRSYMQNIFLFTDFLSPAQQEYFWSAEREEREIKECGYHIFGGIAGAERVMIRFGNPEVYGYEQEFPIWCMEISPVQKKFAEELTHRDFLGALMNLGIERDTLGDIIVEDAVGYLFCKEKVGPFIQENLSRVRHTSVECTRLTELPQVLKKEPERQEFTVSSERIDAVVSRLYNIARSVCSDLFAAGKVWVNGRLTEKPGLTLKEEDVVSVRGYGKFIYYGQQRETRKGRISVAVGVYR